GRAGEGDRRREEHDVDVVASAVVRRARRARRATVVHLCPLILLPWSHRWWHRQSPYFSRVYAVRAGMSLASMTHMSNHGGSSAILAKSSFFVIAGLGLMAAIACSSSDSGTTTTPAPL